MLVKMVDSYGKRNIQGMLTGKIGTLLGLTLKREMTNQLKLDSLLQQIVDTTKYKDG